jgi:type IV secretion system protein VirD4
LQKSRILHSGDTYLVLPVDKLQTYGRWLRLMASIAIRTVARNERKLANPVAFILDEFGTIGALKAVSQAYGLMAGLNMTLWVFVQDFVQLRRDYPDDWETFIGNSQAVTCFGVMDQFTARYISDMVGTATLERISVATAEKREGGILRSGDPNYTAMADQMIPVPLMRPEDIRTMDERNGLILHRGNISPQCYILRVVSSHPTRRREPDRTAPAADGSNNRRAGPRFCRPAGQ